MLQYLLVLSLQLAAGPRDNDELGFIRCCISYKHTRIIIRTIYLLNETCMNAEKIRYYIRNFMQVQALSDDPVSEYRDITQ